MRASLRETQRCRGAEEKKKKRTENAVIKTILKVKSCTELILQRKPDQKLKKKKQEDSTVEMDKTFLVRAILFTSAEMARLDLSSA